MAMGQLPHDLTHEAATCLPSFLFSLHLTLSYEAYPYIQDIQDIRARYEERKRRRWNASLGTPRARFSSCEPI
jgi:hypothetical protein